MKDEKKLHGAVDESSSEQQFHKLTRLPLLCENFGAILLVLVGLMAGSPAGQQLDEMVVDFEIFIILYRSHC